MRIANKHLAFSLFILGITTLISACVSAGAAPTPTMLPTPPAESRQTLLSPIVDEGRGEEEPRLTLEVSAAHEVFATEALLTPALPPPTEETPIPPAVGVLPEVYYITGITGHRQYFSLGCEASATIDWANYLGISINEAEFQDRLPLSDNPDYGFVGSVNGPWGQVPPYAYGVHAGPVAELLQEYGINAQGEKGFSTERLKSEIASGQPVIAWVIGNCVGGIPHEYIDSEGRTVTVAAYEHVVIVTGYSDVEDTLRYMNNGKFYDIPTEYFERSWGVLENMVVYIAD